MGNIFLVLKVGDTIHQGGSIFSSKICLRGTLFPGELCLGRQYSLVYIMSGGHYLGGTLFTMTTVVLGKCTVVAIHREPFSIREGHLNYDITTTIAMH